MLHDYIPYELRSAVTQIDPYLDVYWQHALSAIFQRISPEQQQLIYTQILVKKNILWDRQTQQFSVTPLVKLAEQVHGISHPGMRHLGQKLLAALETLARYDDALEIANFLESILAQLHKTNVEENLSLQQIKNTLHQAFIYAAAEIIHQKTELKIPENQRKLTTDMLKCFISEVFLKQQLLSFYFKTLRARQLSKQSHPLLHDFLKHAQQLRQLEVIKTSRYIFALAQSDGTDINPFSIRRFLNEEYLALSDNIYLNGVVLDLAYLNEPEHQAFFQWQVSRIVTVEKLIGQHLIDFVYQLEQFNSEKLLPLLFKPLDASGLGLEKVLQNRLMEFEKELCVHVLEPIHQALRQRATSTDECDYLYMSTRQLLGDVISYFYDFQSQAAVMFDSQADLFCARLKSYLALHEKRRLQVFALLPAEDWAHLHEQMQQPLEQLNLVVRAALHQYRENYRLIKDLKRKANKDTQSLLGKLMNSAKKTEEQLQNLHLDNVQLRQHAYLDIIRIPKKYPNLTSYLEFEALISVNQKERHYAFPCGDNGLTHLPLLVQLPEDRNLMNLTDLYQALEFDLKLSSQKWSDFELSRSA